MQDEPVNDVLNTAQELMGHAVPRQVRHILDAWARGRIAEGVDPAELAHLLRGESTLEVSTGTLLAEATGSAKLLEGTVPEISAAVEAGLEDEVLGELRQYEIHTSGRKGVLRALDDRTAAHRTEVLVDHTLEELERDLAMGLHDEELEAHLELEKARKNRKGAVALYEERLAIRTHLRVLHGTVKDLELWLEAHEDAPIEAMREAEQRGKARTTALELLGA